MKIIRLTESQFINLLKRKCLSENNDNGAPDFSNGDIKEYPDSEVTTTNHITNSDGDLEYGKPNDTDKFQKELTMQDFWANGCRGTRAI